MDPAAHTMEAIDKLTDDYLQKVSEYTDAIQIFLCFQEDHHTQSATRGAGNWMARVAMARQFLIEDKVKIEEHARMQVYEGGCEHCDGDHEEG